MSVDLPRDLSEQLLWTANHEGRINQLWKSQLLLNTKIDTRLSVLEKRVIWVVGVLTAAGQALPRLLG